MNNLRGKHVRAKQEGDTSDIKSSRQWAGFKNPRIVRVSRSFGGKDRHSKVCTIRGLRDRRIRLSVPSAVQLYDLQDRLGLNQPSKVVDWLLDITKDDIDKLPPLPFGDFTQIYQQALAPHDQELINSTPQSSLSPFFNTDTEFVKDGGIQRKEGLHNSHVAATRKSKNWATYDAHSKEKQKEVERGNNIVDSKWNVTTDHEDGISGSYIPQLSAQNFLPLVHQFSIPGLMNNTVAYNWEPSNLSLSQLGNQVMFPSQVINSQSSTQSVPPLGAHPAPSQYGFYPPATTPLLAPQYPSYMTSLNESDPRLNMSSGSHNIGPNSFVSPFRFANPFNMINTKENLQNSEDMAK